MTDMDSVNKFASNKRNESQAKWAIQSLFKFSHTTDNLFTRFFREVLLDTCV